VLLDRRHAGAVDRVHVGRVALPRADRQPGRVRAGAQRPGPRARRARPRAAVVRPQRGDQGAGAGGAASLGGADRARPGRPMALLSASTNSATPATATQWTAIRSIEYSGL